VWRSALGGVLAGEVARGAMDGPGAAAITAAVLGGNAVRLDGLATGGPANPA
jgi:hypothetical protein